LEAALLTALNRFAGLDRSDFSFGALQAAQQRLPKGEQRDAFAADFTVVQGLWEFLWPSGALEPFRADYKWMAHIYESVKPTGVSAALLWQRLGAKTLELVHGHISGVDVRGTGLDEVIVDEATIEAIRQLALPNQPLPGQGEPLTVEEAMDTIEARLRRRLGESGNHPVYVALSERLERLRKAQLEQASASLAFLRELLELAQQVTAAEKAEEAGKLDLLPDPNVGALTQIFREYAPPDVPVIVENVVNDIDTIVKQVRFTGWNSTQAGDRVVRKEVRAVLKKYGLPTTGDLFDRAYAYIHENY
jgi:type I restriction enzyme R subunit